MVNSIVSMVLATTLVNRVNGLATVNSSRVKSAVKNMDVHSNE